MVNYVPKKCDVVWLEFEPQKGKEIQKTRPALVISPHQYNKKTGLALFMPITSQVKNYPFEVSIEVAGIKGVVLCDQLRSLDWHARKASFIGTLPPSEVADILKKLFVLLE